MQTKSILTATSLAVQGVGITISPGNIIRDLPNTKINVFPIDKQIMKLNYFIATKKYRHINIISTLQDLITAFKNLKFESNLKDLKQK